MAPEYSFKLIVSELGQEGVMLPFPVPHDLFPVEHRFIDLDKARIHYVDEGTGEPVLLLHGNPTWSFLYRKIIAGLSDEFRCIAPDYPGYGMSSAAPGYHFTPGEHSAVIERFVDRLGLSGLTLERAQAIRAGIPRSPNDSAARRLALRTGRRRKADSRGNKELPREQSRR